MALSPSGERYEGLAACCLAVVERGGLCPPLPTLSPEGERTKWQLTTPKPPPHPTPSIQPCDKRTFAPIARAPISPPCQAPPIPAPSSIAPTRPIDRTRTR